MHNIRESELKDVFSHFYHITGVMIVLYDRDFRKIFSYPEDHCAFCREWRSSSEREEKCISSDLHALQKCRDDGAMQEYHCHMGLTECAVPIQRGDTILGFLLIGQILSERNRLLISENVKRLSLQPSTREALITALENMQANDEDKILSIAKIAEICACYLMVHEIYDVKESILVGEIRKWILSHLHEPLTADTICEHFLLSRSSFYRLLKANGIEDLHHYITDHRIQKAKSLLRDTPLSVSEISEACGFSDPNYFIKVFKKYTGITPKVWRTK